MLATSSKRGTCRSCLFCVATALVIFGCGSNVEPPRAAQSPSSSVPAATVPTVVSVNAVMVGMVDHAGHVIWDAATDQKAPKTDQDWEEVEHHAIQLAASGTLIALGGTGPADPGWAQLPDWKKYSKELSDEGIVVLNAARSKNRDGISKAGDQIVATCEGCHKQFKPDLPTEGLVHSHYR